MYSNKNIMFWTDIKWKYVHSGFESTQVYLTKKIEWICLYIAHECRAREGHRKFKYLNCMC